MGFFDELFDWNGDGRMDDLEESVGFAYSMMALEEDEDEEDNEE